MLVWVYSLACLLCGVWYVVVGWDGPGLIDLSCVAV